MGLDITAYSKLTAVGKHVADGQWCEEDGHVTALAYDCFPASFRGIPVLGTSTYGGSAFIDGGCYAETSGTETLGFRAGSYGGYGQWRDNLRLQFNPNTDPDLPFYELIWFADNEGCIGPDAAADLLADFRAHADVYAPPRPEPWPDYYTDKYLNWTRACELAAEAGLIQFH